MMTFKKQLLITTVMVIGMPCLVWNPPAEMGRTDDDPNNLERMKFYEPSVVRAVDDFFKNKSIEVLIPRVAASSGAKPPDVIWFGMTADADDEQGQDKRKAERQLCENGEEDKNPDNTPRADK